MQTAAELITNITWADNLARAVESGHAKAGGWGSWRGGDVDKGSHVVCALSAIQPGIRGDVDVPCQSVHMPAWMAPLVRTLFDGMVDPAAFYTAFGPAIRVFHHLDDAAWERVRIGHLKGVVTQALEVAESAQPTPRPAYWDQVQGACGQVLAALDGKGDLSAARAAAYAAARAAAYRQMTDRLASLILAEVA